MTCPHGFAKTAQCVDCMLDGPVEPPATWRKVGEPFEARYDGECRCGRRITAGSLVQRWDHGAAGQRDAETAYLHERCAP